MLKSRLCVLDMDAKGSVVHLKRLSTQAKDTVRYLVCINKTGRAREKTLPRDELG